MALDFRIARISIPSGTSERTFNESVVFSRNVREANVALQGFRLDYSSSDHHIDTVKVDVNLRSFSGNTVRFSVTVDYADKNNDDRYNGNIDVLVIADIF